MTPKWFCGILQSKRGALWTKIEAYFTLKAIYEDWEVLWKLSPACPAFFLDTNAGLCRRKVKSGAARDFLSRPSAIFPWRQAQSSSLPQPVPISRAWTMQYKQAYYQCRGCGKAFFDGNGNKKERLCPECRATKNQAICSCCHAAPVHPSNHFLCWPCFVTDGEPTLYFHIGEIGKRYEAKEAEGGAHGR